jgi:hypothetical protein
MRTNVLITSCSLLVLFSQSAGAVPKGKNGETCNVSSATNVDHKIGDKNYKCDKCVYTQCSTSGGEVSNCQQVTHWSNCVEQASSTGPGGKAGVESGVKSGGQMAPPTSPKPKLPRFEAPAAKSAQ